MCQETSNSRIKWIYWLLLTVLSIGLLSGCASEKKSISNPPIPETTKAKEELPAWRQIEAALSEALLGTVDGKCEWEVWGWREQDRYLWAFCQAEAGFDAAAVSLPVVVHEASDGSVEDVDFPAEGSDFELSVKKWFPPAVQEKILANDFDLASAMGHLEERWSYPSMPPSIYSRTDQSLPISGDPAVQAVSSRTAGQITQSAVLGQGNIKSLKYLPDGQISVSGDRGIGILDIKSGQIAYQYQDLLAGRPGFLSNDGKRLVVVDDQTVQVYEVDTQSILISIETSLIAGQINRVHFLSDGMTLIVEKTLPEAQNLKAQFGMYQLSDGRLLDTWESGGLNSVVSPDGRILVDTASLWGTYVWSIHNSELKYTLPVISKAVSFSGDSQIMAVAGFGKVHLVWVWDGFEIGSLQKGVGSVSGAALSPDGKLVLTWSDGPNPARLWTVPDFQPVATLDIQGVSAVAFNEDGSQIALAGDTAVAQYDIVAGDFELTPSETYAAVTDLSFAPDRAFSQGQRLAAAHSRGVVVNWDVTTKEPIFVQPDHSALTLAYANEPYGIAAGTMDKTVVMLDGEDGSLIRKFTGFSDQVQELAVSSSNHLAVGLLNEVRLFSLANQDEKRGREIRIAGGWVENLMWGCYLIAKSADGKVHVMDESGVEVKQKFGLTTYGYDAPLALNGNCSQLLAANYLSVYRWETITWDQLPTWTMENMITAMAVSTDGTLIAIGSIDGSIQLLDSDSGEILNHLDGHSGPVTALEFSPDGVFMASGGSDGVVILWAVE